MGSYLPPHPERWGRIGGHCTCPRGRCGSPALSPRTNPYLSLLPCVGILWVISICCRPVASRGARLEDCSESTHSRRINIFLGFGTEHGLAPHLSKHAGCIHL